MKRILMIEDDSLVANVYSERLRAEGLIVDVAPDGDAGLKMFHDRKVDLVLLDLLLPQMSGVDLLKQIRSEFTPCDLPVVVFTNAYLGGAVQQAWEAGANQVIPKAGTRPNMVVQMVKNALKAPPPAAVKVKPIESKVEIDPTVRQELLGSSSETLAALWRPLKQLAGQGHHDDNHQCFEELFQVIRPLTGRAVLAGLDGIARMFTALEALLKELHDKPERMNPSALLTIAQAIDTLKLLFAHPDSPSAKNPPQAHILVVDDDEFTRRAVGRALARVNLKAICVDGPVRALKRRTGKRFDLIILDIELPDASGFDLCSRFRAMPACQDTPIIFLSMHRDLNDRTESALRGGSDYITKPFLYMELATKALGFILSAPLKAAQPAEEANNTNAEKVFSRRELNALKQALLSSYDS
jgi:DNA-binding response OmpR family regulator